MGVQKAELEITSSLSAEKIFKGLVLDVDIIIPKATPEAYKNVEIKGGGGAGTIKNFTFPDGIPITTATVRIDAVDKQGYTFDYSVIDGDILFGFIDKIENHLVVVSMADGGSKTKITATFHTKGDAIVPETNIKFADKQHIALFKAIEAYLIAT